MRICPFHGCKNTLLDRVFACRKHWFMLNQAERSEIMESYADYQTDRIGVDELRRRQQDVLGDRGDACRSDAKVLTPKPVTPPAVTAKPAPCPLQIRDLLIRYVELHDASCPDQRDGKPCAERANILAFLAHSIGFNSSDMLMFKRLLVDYEVHCTNADHCHERTET